MLPLESRNPIIPRVGTSSIDIDGRRVELGRSKMSSERLTEQKIIALMGIPSAQARFVFSEIQPEEKLKFSNHLESGRISVQRSISLLVINQEGHYFAFRAQRPSDGDRFLL